uniref:Uncharacterized protein n=1 Tax=Amphimedon queenslandica TaxID=400682 RepID=A0A1X7U1A7_AMPQE
MYERLLGVDHSSSISAYYCCGAERNVVALRLLYRVRYLIMLTHGEDHPEMSNVDFYIGLLLSNAGHYEESQAYLESALDYKTIIIFLPTHRLTLEHLLKLSKIRERHTISTGLNFAQIMHVLFSLIKNVRYITEKQVTYDQTVSVVG